MDGDQEKTKDINIPAPRGRKNYVPSKESRELVQAMRIIGMPVETAAQLIKNTSGKFGISMETFYKYYRHEWEHGDYEANAKVAGTLYKKALSGDVAAMIFWCKTRLGWRTTDPASMPQPIDIGVTINNTTGRLEEISDAELNALNSARSVLTRISQTPTIGN